MDLRVFPGLDYKEGSLVYFLAESVLRDGDVTCLQAVVRPFVDASWETSLPGLQDGTRETP